MKEYNGICIQCGNEFILKRKGISSRNSNNQGFDLCTNCIQSNVRKNVYDNMTDEQKSARGNKISNSRKNKSNEEKEVIRNKVIATWNSNRVQNIETLKNVHKTMSDDRRAAMYLKMSEKRKEWWSHLTEEDLAVIKENASKRELERLGKMSGEQKMYYKLDLGDKHKKYFEKLSGIELEKYFQNLAIGISKSEVLRGPTERTFANDLSMYNISYEWGYVNQTIHPNFYQTFPINPVTNSRVSPYHAWDFKVNGLNRSVLVDVDGAIHVQNITAMHKSGIKIDMYDLVAFNDSQRSYQTDNMQWYIIQCYTDKLLDSTKVWTSDGELITYKDLLNILQCDNIKKKEG